jgi:hypothetical protein
VPTPGPWATAVDGEPVGPAPLLAVFRRLPLDPDELEPRS